MNQAIISVAATPNKQERWFHAVLRISLLRRFKSERFHTRPESVPTPTVAPFLARLFAREVGFLQNACPTEPKDSYQDTPSGPSKHIGHTFPGECEAYPCPPAAQTCRSTSSQPRYNLRCSPRWRIDPDCPFPCRYRWTWRPLIFPRLHAESTCRCPPATRRPSSCPSFDMCRNSCPHRPWFAQTRRGR